MSNQIIVKKTTNPKQKPDATNLEFGHHFTDHMFLMDYSPEKGWHDAQIVPYGPLSFDPSTTVFHYGQSIFEGLKAYKNPDNEILLFRPEKNIERLNISNERLCIPRIDPDFAIQALRELVKLDSDWIPQAPGTSLYIRPFTIATDPYLGIRPSSSYKFIIILCPVGMYYKEGLNPVKIHVETDYVRCVKGGLGYAKTSANYAASLKAQVQAKEKGFTQVLWLDGVYRKYIEEVGTMNIFFRLKDEVVTPALNGSILGGITRASTIELLNFWGIKVVEKQISIEEIYESYTNGDLLEAFGTGTAAVISPVGELHWNGKNMILNKGKTGELSNRLYESITGIQNGLIEDKLNWIVKV